MGQTAEYGLDDIDIYTWGLCYASVCVPRDMPRDEIERLTNLKNPTGISSPWVISTDTHFRRDKDGDVKPNPCPCSRNAESHLHYLLIC